MKGQYYLADLMLKENLKIKSDYINLVVAPCGSGKTTFALDEYLNNTYKYVEGNLKWQHSFDLDKVLYITDTSMLKHSILKHHKNIAEDFTKDTFKKAREEDLIEKMVSNKSKITVITYAKFGSLLKNEKCRNIIFKHFNSTILDEFHNLIYYYERFDKDKEYIKENRYYAEILKYLPILSKKCEVVALTATPYKARYYAKEKEKFGKSIREVIPDKFQKDLLQYEEKAKLGFVQLYNEIKDIVNSKKEKEKVLKGINKILIYTPRINRCIKYKEMLANAGYNVEALWSSKNEKHPISKEQEYLREYLIENEKLPDDLGILIINSAFETGWNLHDDRVKYVWVDHKNPDVKIQVRNRVRGDIKVLFHKTNEKEILEVHGYNKKWTTHEERIFSGEVDMKFLGVKMTSELKNEMKDIYGRVRNSGKEITWKDLQDDLIKKGYIVDVTNNGTYIYTQELFEKKTYKKTNKDKLSDYLQSLTTGTEITTQDIYSGAGLTNNQLKECRRDKDIKKWFDEHTVKKGKYIV